MAPPSPALAPGVVQRLSPTPSKEEALAWMSAKERWVPGGIAASSITEMRAACAAVGITELGLSRKERVKKLRAIEVRQRLQHPGGRRAAR